MADFELDTAVQALGGGVYACSASHEWAAPNGPNGGYLAALFVRAIEGEVGDPQRPLRSLHLHFLRPPRDGTARIDLSVERAGRGVTTLSARMTQDDRLCVLGLAACGVDRQALADWQTAPPQVPPPEDVKPIPALEGMPPIAHRVEARPALGPVPFSGGDEALTGGWLRLAEPRRCDTALAALYLDGWLPCAFARTDRPAAAPTVDMAFHFRARLPEQAPAAETPLLARFRSSTSAHGFFEEDGEIWSPDGVLLAQSRQLALLVP